jgi:hypothetical protein
MMASIRRSSAALLFIASLAIPVASYAQVTPLSVIAKATTPIVAPTQTVCYTFTHTLAQGSKDASVTLLQYFLQKEGMTVGSTEAGMYGSTTMAAVKAFQEKYAADILTPNSLKMGTGRLGKSTEAKMNTLYSCSAQAMAAKSAVVTPVTTPAVTATNFVVTGTVLDSNGVTATFCNKGTNDVPSFPVRIRLNGINQDFEIVGAQKAGACYTNTFGYSTWGLNFDPGSTFTVVVLIDPNGTYKTSNITFPLGTTDTLSVPAVMGNHLSVRSVLLKSSGIQATFCNLGTINLTSFPVRITLNNSAQDFDVPGAYQSGKCTPMSWPYTTWSTYVPGSVVNASITVDPKNIFSETNEFDNSAAIVGTP